MSARRKLQTIALRDFTNTVTIGPLTCIYLGEDTPPEQFAPAETREFHSKAGDISTWHSGEDALTNEELLEKVADLQVEYWDKLSELEAALGGIEIDGGEPLSGRTVEDLLQEAEV